MKKKTTIPSKRGQKKQKTKIRNDEILHDSPTPQKLSEHHTTSHTIK